MTDFVSEARDGMRIDWDVPIRVDDGLLLRADVFRPTDAGKHPVILAYGPYGKWLHFEDLYTDQWRRMIEQHPDVPAGSTNKYQNWEVVDPEKPDPAVAPALRPGPFNALVEITSLPGREWVQEPGRTPGSARVHPHAHIPIRHPLLRIHRFPLLVPVR